MQHTDSQATRIDIDGMRLHCLTAGESGSPVVLLHGGGLDSAELSWGEVMGPLSAGHRVFAPDLPGYGQSSRPALRYTLDFYITVVKQVLDSLHLDGISLVGLSLGGAIALALTLDAPKRVGKAFISLQRSDVRWSGLRSNFTARLHEITVPTLLVHGAQDQAVPLAYAKRAHALIPRSELSIMQECRHWPQREKPEEFTRVVGNFLDE